MDDIGARFLLVVGALAVAGISTLVLRFRNKPGPRNLPVTGLAEGVYLFTSAACSDCMEARELLDDVLGESGYRELSWEQDPGLFDELDVEGVPATMIVGDDGSGVLWPGRPDKVLRLLGP